MSAPAGFVAGLLLAGVLVVAVACWVERPYRHWRQP